MLGTTLGVKEGNQVTANSLTAFGEPLSTLPMEDSFFTGKPHVGEMGYAFLFRAYRADQGKWQTADPLGYPDGWNNFAYVNNGVFHKLDVIGFKELSVVFITNNTVDGDAEAFRESGRHDYVFTNISSIEQMVVAMETIKIQGDSIKKWCVSGHANGSITGAFF